MTRFTSIVSTLALVPTSLALASHWGTEGAYPVDFNCDGKVGLGDWELVGQMVAAEHAPHYDRTSSLENLGLQP